jgi:hypothetical protein
MSRRTQTILLGVLAVGASVASIHAGERTEQQPRKEVPLIQEIDLGTVHLDPAGRSSGQKGEEVRFGAGYAYPSSLDFAEVSLANLGKYVPGEDAEAKITRQIDPDQQQLLLVRWYVGDGPRECRVPARGREGAGTDSGEISRRSAPSTLACSRQTIG